MTKLKALRAYTDAAGTQRAKGEIFNLPDTLADDEIRARKAEKVPGPEDRERAVLRPPLKKTKEKT
jgi:hypothetical protein